MSERRISFNKPLSLGGELEALNQVLESGELGCVGGFGQRCESWLSEYAGGAGALMTSSCTHALEIAALLLDLRPGDEVIMPSWTYVSTANAFVLRGAKPVFVDISLDECNIDVALIEPAITPRTRAIVAVHYGGVCADMDAIMALAERYQLWVIEDAAHALMSRLGLRPAGTMAHLAAFSFHSTKNYTSGGQGGALLVNKPELLPRARIIRDKGTNRDAFYRGDVSRYEWLDVGSSYTLSELQAAFLSVQLAAAAQVNQRRRQLWYRYYDALKGHAEEGSRFQLARVPDAVEHNAHLFFLRTESRQQRDHLLLELNNMGVMAQTHYEPLHLSPAGQRHGRFNGDDANTLLAHQTLLRLPLHYALTDADQDYVIARLMELKPA